MNVCQILSAGKSCTSLRWQYTIKPVMKLVLSAGIYKTTNERIPLRPGQELRMTDTGHSAATNPTHGVDVLSLLPGPFLRNENILIDVVP
jgi:hypothetical protein